MTLHSAHIVNPRARAIRIHTFCQSLSLGWGGFIKLNYETSLLSLLRSFRTSWCHVTVSQDVLSYEAMKQKQTFFFHTLLNNVAEFVKSYLIQSDPLLETMCLVSMGCNGSFLKTLSLIMGEWLLSLFSQAACADKKWEALWVSQMSKENYAGSIMSIRR